MADEYIDSQDISMICEAVSRASDGENVSDVSKEFGDISGYDENYEDDESGNSFRNGRGRGNFRARGRGPPPGWMNGPPMRFRGRGYGPGGPPMRGRGFFRGRGGPRNFGPNNGPNFDNWGPMGPPPPGMMGGPPPFGPPPGMMPGGPMGPPPNMMGQPPPYGGPPGMPPPNMPAPELWVETKSDEGKSYYYHARTRETTWTRPQDTPTCKVITQAEMEAMAASGQMPNMGGPQTMPMGGPPMGGPPMGMMPNGMMGNMMPPGVAPQNSVPPFMTQPPPWVKDGEDYFNGAKDKAMDQDAPIDNDDMPPGESAPVTSSSNGNLNFTSAPPSNYPGGGFPGPGGPGGTGGYPAGWGGWGSWPPPMGPPTMNPGPGAMPEAGKQMPQMGNISNSGGQQPTLSSSEPVIIDSPTHTPAKKDETSPTAGAPASGGASLAALAALASAWTAHAAPDGRPYYYHAANQESVWEKPKPMRDLEELQAKLAAEKNEKKVEKNEIDESKIEVIDVEAHAEAAAAAAAALEASREERERERERERARTADRERMLRERQDQERQDKEKADKEKAKQDKSRPISSTPISGTPWCVVWTGDGRVFFYNPTAHSSVWERPPQLASRADVDHAVANPPAALHDLQRKDSTTSTTASTTAAAASRANGDLKRLADSDSDDSDSDPPKKVKADDSKKPPSTTTGNIGTIDLGKEAAIEAEVRAARERAVVPHDQRVRAFLAMLRDKDVSAFSTWEKELQKIVFDPRYLMLDSKERRQVFDQYVRERAEEERKEKKNRLQQKKVAFRLLMDEAKLHSKSSYTEFSSKHGRDDRFKGIEKPRDREACFNEYIAEVRKKEKEDKEKKREQIKGEFIALLKEKAVDRRARWAEAKKKVDTDPRYKAVESSTLRDDYFREYCKMVKEERKREKDVKEKEKERDRSSSKKEKKDKDREKEKEKDKDKDKEKEREGKDVKKEKKKEKGEKDPPPSEPETVEAEEASAGSDTSLAKEKEARAQASIKEREREVQRALATSLRDRDKEREYHKRDEAVQHFNALLADLVRNPDLSWREAKKQLKKDHRYSLAELLAKEDKERLFGQHTSTLANKRRDKLRNMLTELGVTCTAHWREVKDLLKQEPTAPVYGSITQMEREFRDFQRDKQSAAKTALRQLLLETRSITHKSLASVKENANALQQILAPLKHDARYQALEHVPDERQQIISQYLEELEKKGPPPPPTATEPSRRSKQ